MPDHAVVSEAEWIEARKALLLKEKALTHQWEDIARERRALPWTKVEKNYIFQGPNGPEALADLFQGRSELIVYHFMFAPGWEEGCPGCSFLADHFDGANLHLPHGGASFVAVSRAPYEEFQAFKKRMGWNFKWISAHGSDFNIDYQVSFTEESIADGKRTYNYEEVPEKKPGETPGASVFFKDENGDVFHTYSTYARGLEAMIGTFMWLDLTPLGRNETGTMSWMRHHDKYEGASATSCCH